MARSALSRDEVLDTAAALVREHGPGALTMRRLAAELGTAVTSIYWHVGNRESLLDALVARTVTDLGTIDPHGTTPAERIVSVARTLRRALRERPHLVAMVHERGLTERMFLPAQRALVHEAHAAGLRGEDAARAVRALQFQVVGYVLVERNRERAPAQSPAEEELWSEEPAGADPVLARALAAPIDTEALFVDSVRALVDGLLAGPSGETGDSAVGRGPYSH
ncbi:TetR/AcrR family transcriptional regulator [Streptomyces sp. NBC_00094]|uniref:TetR/AcrR family transcriptional regulator n=1 Tax=Streptomyces sp. NBC_00094 TaxID=2903620 RepID=UPI00225AE0C0|nr:TetR/AcrR family transcriptional regulator [Streptomyces sp. NBC_00094]MCX5389912.1 TetR family transcriptional regulator [Streptomyces sp. NBC_00094]